MDDINLTDYLQIIWRRRSMVIMTGITVMLIAFVVLLMTPHTYRGRAVLIFPHSEQSAAAGALSKLGLSGMVDFGVAGGNGPEMYIGILKSRTLSEQVGHELKLGPVVEDYSNLQDKIDVTVTKQGTLELCCYAPSSWIKSGKLDVKSNGKNADQQTARLAAEMANAYIRQLQEFDKQHSINSGHRNRKFLEKEVEKTRRELSDAEEALRKFRESHPALPPPETVSQQVEQLISLRTMQIQAEAEVRETERSAEEAKKAVGDHETIIEASKVVQENAVVSQLKSRLAQAEVLRARLLEDMTEKSPDVVDATLEIEKIKEQIKSEVPRITASETLQINPIRQSLVQELAQLEIKKSGAQARLDTLDTVLTRVEDGISNGVKDQMRYVRIMRDVKAQEVVYTSLVAQLSQAKVLEAKEPEGFTVLDWAVAEKYRYKPKIKFTLAAAFLIGLVPGCLLALARESSHPSVKRKAVRQIEE